MSDSSPQLHHHIAVFGDLFDLPERARKILGEDVRITLFVPKPRLASCDGVEHADAVIALAEQAEAQAWTDALRAVHTAQPLTHAVAFVDHLATEAALALEAVGVPFHTPRTMQLVGDKALMREALEQRGLHSVPFRRTATPAQARSAVSELGTPCVVKPVNGTASAGVVVVHDETETEGALREAFAQGAEVLVERYVQGPQYSVEAMSENGEHVLLAVTRKYTDPVSLVELGHVMPAPLSEPDAAAIWACTTDVLDAVGLTYGPSHTEIVLGPEGPVPIETHARVGGDDLWLMVHDATGVDLDAVQPDQALGRSVLGEIRRASADHAPERRHQAVWFGAVGKAGTYPDVDLADTVDVSEHVTVTPLKKAGDALSPLASSGDRVLKVRATGTSAEEALELARRTVADCTGVLPLDRRLTRVADTL